MKIGLVCNMGGHLTEMLLLMEAFEGQEIFFVTYKDPRANQIKDNTYFLENIDVNLGKMIKASFMIYHILRKEKPNLLISTGSEIAIPTFILAKMMGIKTIYIESWTRVKTKSKTGKILYYFSNVFLVQWKDLLEKYGKKAKYEGAVI